MKLFMPSPNLLDSASNILSKTMAYAYDRIYHQSPSDYSKIKIEAKKDLLGHLNKALLNSIDIDAYSKLTTSEKIELQSKIAFALYKKAFQFETKAYIWDQYDDDYECLAVLGISISSSESYAEDHHRATTMARFPNALFKNKNHLEEIITDTVAEQNQHLLNSGSIFSFHNI